MTTKKRITSAPIGAQDSVIRALQLGGHIVCWTGFRNDVAKSRRLAHCSDGRSVVLRHVDGREEKITEGVFLRLLKNEVIVGRLPPDPTPAVTVHATEIFRLHPEHK